MRFAPWLFVLSIGGACALPSTDEYSSGSPDGGTSSSSSSSGASVTEAGVDGASSDAGDAMPFDPDAASPEFVCPAGTEYCEDFSERTAAGVGVVAVDPDASIEVVNEVLVSTMPAYPSAGHHSANIVHFVNRSLKTRVEVDVNVSPATWSGGKGNMVILALHYDGQPNNHVEELYISGDQTSVTTTVNGGQLVYDVADKDFPRGQWVHVTLDADFTPNAGSFRLSYGDTVVSRSNIGFSASTDVAMNVLLGMVRNNAPTPALTVRYDNFVVTFL